MAGDSLARALFRLEQGTESYAAELPVFSSVPLMTWRLPRMNVRFCFPSTEKGLHHRYDSKRNLARAVAAATGESGSRRSDGADSRG